MQPLFVVTGATGHTGSVVARELLAAGKKVRVVGRDGGRLTPLASAGAVPFVCDIADPKALARAFSGARAVYAMIPPNLASPDYRAYQDRVSDSLAAALKKAKVKYAVSLSSVGAGRSGNTGPIAGTRYLEQQLNQIDGLYALHLRPGYFMENLLPQIGIIKATGYTAGLLRPDLRLPMIATRDIGAAAAKALLNLEDTGRQALELLGPRDVTMSEATSIIGAAIGKPDLQYVQSAETDTRDALVQLGISPNVAGLIVEMSVAWNSGLVAASESRSATNSTPTSLEIFVSEEFAPAYRRGTTLSAEG